RKPRRGLQSVKSAPLFHGGFLEFGLGHGLVHRSISQDDNASVVEVAIHFVTDNGRSAAGDLNRVSRLFDADTEIPGLLLGGQILPESACGWFLGLGGISLVELGEFLEILGDPLSLVGPAFGFGPRWGEWLARAVAAQQQQQRTREPEPGSEAPHFQNLS